MTGLELVQLISVLSPLAEQALSQGREVTQAELETAMTRLDANVAVLEALIAAKKAQGS